MTEAEWLASKDPVAILEELRGKISDRKFRLIACAIARCLPPLSNAEENRERQRVIVAAERFAEGLLTRRGLAKLRRCRSGSGVWAVASSDAFDAALNSVRDCALQKRKHTMIRRIREIGGNPFQPITVEPAWLAWNGETVVALARTIAAEKRFKDMPILADALEDAGCTSTAITDHCRGPGLHTRGCWLIDLLLAKQ